MNAKHLLQKAQSNMAKDNAQAQSKEKARALANINEDILNKVESMIETKKKPEKVLNNNPPKKEIAQTGNFDNAERKAGWDPHFNPSTHR